MRSKRWFLGLKFAAWVLGLLLVVGSGLATAAGNGNSSSGTEESATMSAPAHRTGRVEIKEDRTPTPRPSAFPMGAPNAGLCESG